MKKLVVAAVLAALSTPALTHAAEPLRVGYLPVTGHAKLFVARKYGLFAREGVDVELVEFVNSADGINALRAGKIDVGAFGTTAPLVHVDRGADLRIIGGIMGGDAALITSAGNAPAIKRIADLKGRKVATVRLSTGDAVLRGALRDAGLDWRKDLQLFELKSPPAVIEAVKSGEVDAGMIWGPHDLRAEAQGLVVVVRSDQLHAGHPCCRLTVAADRLARRERWIAFLRAILRAEKFTRDEREKTLDAIVEYVKLERPLVEKAFYGGHVEISTDPNLTGVRKFWTTLQASELVTSREDIGGRVDGSIYRAALDGLARDEPREPFWNELQRRYRERNL